MRGRRESEGRIGKEGEEGGRKGEKRGGRMRIGRKRKEG